MLDPDHYDRLSQFRAPCDSRYWCGRLPIGSLANALQYFDDYSDKVLVSSSRTIAIAAFGMLVGFYELFSGLANARMADVVVKLIGDDVQENSERNRHE